MLACGAIPSENVRPSDLTMAPFLICVFVLVATILVFRLMVQRAITLCELRVASGDVTVVRGGVRASVMNDLRDVIEEDRIDGVRISILRDRGRARVDVKGPIDAGSLQRLRNVVSAVPYTNLLARSR